MRWGALVAVMVGSGIAPERGVLVEATCGGVVDAICRGEGGPSWPVGEAVAGFSLILMDLHGFTWIILNTHTHRHMRVMSMFSPLGVFFFFLNLFFITEQSFYVFFFFFFFLLKIL